MKMMENIPAPRKKPILKGDMNWLARQKCGRILDGFDRKKFEAGYDSIKWRSREKSHTDR